MVNPINIRNKKGNAQVTITDTTNANFQGTGPAILGDRNSINLLDGGSINAAFQFATDTAKQTNSLGLAAINAGQDSLKQAFAANAQNNTNLFSFLGGVLNSLTTANKNTVDSISAANKTENQQTLSTVGGWLKVGMLVFAAVTVTPQLIKALK